MLNWLQIALKAYRSFYDVKSAVTEIPDGADVTKIVDSLRKLPAVYLYDGSAYTLTMLSKKLSIPVSKLELIVSDVAEGEDIQERVDKLLD